jgi:hypothetical protein
MATHQGTSEGIGQKITEKVASVTDKVSEVAEKAADWAKEKLHQVAEKAEELKPAAHAADHLTFAGAPGIREHMEVIASCGTKVGVVDRVQGDVIKLTKDASGHHHVIPTNWVDHVDARVHLNRNHVETERAWQLV